MEPRYIDVEVLPEPPRTGPDSGVARRLPRKESAMGGPPIHPLSALLLLVVDNLWLMPEFLVIDWVITIPLCFLTVLFPTLLIQKLLKKQTGAAALGYSVLLAVIAAVPTSLLGTPVGAAMLAWFGISKLWGGGRDHAAP
ncbi:MAG: hypothetical protein MUC91_00690 [Verrucomicrobia bacterium]|nr:hypothetical protein [Verrucomicrobiota bacterium]